MILSAQTIFTLCNPPDFAKLHGAKPLIEPFEVRTQRHGLSFGLSSCGYDIRVKQDVYLEPGDFMLASSIEKFHLPDDVMAVVHDKSTLARHGLSVFNTVIEPGWFGFLTLELKNQGNETINLVCGSPIAQVIFQRLDHPTVMPYQGKYQDQEDRPVAAIREGL